MEPISSRMYRDAAFDSASYASVIGSIAPAELACWFGWLDAWGAVAGFGLLCVVSWIGLMLAAAMLAGRLPWFCNRIQSSRLLVLAMAGSTVGTFGTLVCGAAGLHLLGKDWNPTSSRDLQMLGVMAFSGAVYGGTMGGFAGLRLRQATGKW
ncbi:hypothetical protein [Luteolibacter sp. LG18]|uniref:hypothetical protein n=1 Tax=Luteolibacter sp. LG18 TaxID=2819286 RepID=UPI002B303A7E|nr:hypothetical protein llg_09600 [Luteolibacter sp. LG18]